MDFEIIKKNHLKRNIIIGIIIVAVISAIILNFTRAKYRITQSIPLVNGTINYSLSDLDVVGLYIDGKEATKLDDNTKYTLDTSKSTCTYKDGSAIDNLNLAYDSDTKTFTINPYTTKGTKCTLYFDELILVKDTILANYSTVLTRDNFTTTVTNTTTGTIYKSKDSSQYDDYGEVYYFAGNPTDNWVKFAGFYWRIIRINGNGTIRMIYQGTSANTTGSGTQIGTSKFNSKHNDNMYVGYMYTSNEVHGYGTNSNIKEMLDTWYIDNLLVYANKIDGNAGFCNDRTPSTSSSSINGSGGIGATVTYYAGYHRFEITKNPTFKCLVNNDLFTTNMATIGNNALTYPIGLISGDDVIFAGSISNYYDDNPINVSTFLNTQSVYYTMTPGELFPSGVATMYVMEPYGTIFYYNVGVTTSYGVRPVINLKADVKLTGSGTSTNPYVVVGAE